MFLQECFKLLNENINEAVVVTNKVGSLVFANQKAECYFGINFRKNIGKCVKKLFQRQS